MGGHRFAPSLNQAARDDGGSPPIKKAAGDSRRLFPLDRIMVVTLPRIKGRLLGRAQPFLAITK